MGGISGEGLGEFVSRQTVEVMWLTVEPVLAAGAEAGGGGGESSRGREVMARERQEGSVRS